jgi:hypothetical protein
MIINEENFADGLFGNLRERRDVCNGDVTSGKVVPRRNKYYFIVIM